MAKWKAPWVDRPPLSAIWILEDTLRTLSGITERVKPPPEDNLKLMTAADKVHDDGNLWSSLPPMIGSLSKAEHRARLRGALDRCRGFN